MALLLVAISSWLRDQLVVADQGRLDALVEIQLAVTTVHLWLEEYVTGDEVELDIITEGLQRAAALYQSMIDGGMVGDIEVRIPPLPAGPVRDSAMAARPHLQAFSEITARRQRGLAQGDEVGIGSEIDARYDQHYHLFINGLRVVEAATRKQLAERVTLARRLAQALLATWLLLIVFSVSGLWTREKKRRQAEEALRVKEHQLMRAQKMDAVGRLAGGITHDINNYVAAITTNCELAQLQLDAGSPIAKKMDAVLRVCGKISDLIEQLLAFSRQQPARRETVNLNDLIGDLDGMLRRMSGEDIHFTTRLEPSLWSTLIDPSQAEQILVNLVVNARQAMPAGGSISIETENIEIGSLSEVAHAGIKPGHYVLLSVRDTGHGIDEQIQDRVFEPFFTTKGEANNSGLGLSTIYGIVVQNKGHVELDSKPGVGTRFRIYLPGDMTLTDRASPGDHERQPGSALQRGAGCVLLVEDNDEFRRSAHGLLEELGYRVLVAIDGRDALQVYARHSNEIDLVLTDMVMPGMSGGELAAAISESGGQVPVLFMSAYTADVLSESRLGGGDMTILQKPFTAAALSSQLREMLDGSAARSKADRHSG